MNDTPKKDRPILFSGPMVRAILEGRKTQTRRVLNPQPSKDTVGFQRVAHDAKSGVPIFEALNADGKPISAFPKGKDFVTPYPTIRFAPGDRLWVRESVTKHPMPNILTGEPTDAIIAAYAADDGDVVDEYEFNLAPWWKGKGGLPSIHMPRWASRLTLAVTDVRVQRLQDISEDDAQAEGIDWDDGHGRLHPTARLAFNSLWDSINSERNDGMFAWDANPWVVAVTFETIKCNIDEMGTASCQTP